MVENVNTTISQPWAPQIPYIEQGYQGAQQNYNTPKTFYPNNMTVPFSPQSESAMQGIEQRAITGNPLLQQAQQHSSDVLSGNYLNQGNPGWANMTQSVYDSIRAPTDTQFAGAGRYGGAGHEEMMARTLGNTMAPLAYQNYNDERQRMMSAMEGAPGLAQQDYFDYGQLAGVGQAREAKGQKTIEEDIARYNFGQNEADQRLSTYMTNILGKAVGGPGGAGTSTVATPVHQNSGGSGLATATSVVGLLGDLKGLFS